MTQQQIKLTNLTGAIMGDAEKAKEAIMREVEQQRKESLAKAEEEILGELYHMIQNRVLEIRNAARQEIARKQIEARKNLLLKREEITAEVISGVAAKLEEFVKSAAYLEFLEQTAKKAAGIVGGEGTVIRLRGEDLCLGDRLAPIFGPGAKVERDDTIRLGGIKIENAGRNISITETLDTRLEQQKDYFSSISGLIIE